MKISLDNNLDNLDLSSLVYIHATDTCYGFACPFNNQTAIKYIQNIKERDIFKPLSLLFKDLFMLSEFCFLNQSQINFINSQLVPASFILAKKNKLADFFSLEKNVSIRLENQNFPIKMSSLLNCPVTSTSVNKSGLDPLYDSKEIKQQFAEYSELHLIDSGHIKHTPPSTIWDLTGKNYIIVRA